MCVCDRETGKVAVEGCDHVVTEMNGMIALLKQRRTGFTKSQSSLFGRFSRPSQIDIAIVLDGKSTKRLHTISTTATHLLCLDEELCALYLHFHQRRFNTMDSCVHIAAVYVFQYVL